MPDTKITALAAITTVAPANDLFAIVDVSDNSMAASGTTKNITTNQILGAGGTATLASATITGDLTVRTNKLAVTSTGVGIGTASPNGTLEVAGSIRTTSSNGSATASIGVFDYVAGTTTRLVSYGANTTTAGAFQFVGLSSNSSVGDIRYSIDATGIATWSNVGGVAGTAMTLNSTGLGVGGSPASKLYVYGANVSGIGQFRIDCPAAGVAQQTFAINGVAQGQVYADGTQFVIGSATSTPLLLRTANTVAVTIDASQNVGVGVTPSAWVSMRAVQVLGASFAGDVTVNRARVISNAYFNGSDYVYLQNNFAGMYVQNAANGTHSWSIAPSGIAGNTITGANAFVQAMTLAANGQLLLGTTSTSSAVDIGMVMNKPSATGFVGNVYQLNSVEKAYTYIASAASAYRIDTVAGYTVNVVSGGTNGVYLGNGGTSWLSLSDERFKDIIEPISNAVAKVGSLRSVIGKFKSEAEGTRRPFLFAQDVQAVLPEAVDATKPEQLGLSYTDVIPLLVAAIQELTAEVNALKKA